MRARNSGGAAAGAGAAATGGGEGAGSAAGGTVGALSCATSLTHWSTGLGVRAAATVLARLSASSSAPRLQLTFIHEPFRTLPSEIAREHFPGVRECNATNWIIKYKVSSHSGDAAPIVDKFRLHLVSRSYPNRYAPQYESLVVEKVSAASGDQRMSNGLSRQALGAPAAGLSIVRSPRYIGSPGSASLSTGYE